MENMQELQNMQKLQNVQKLQNMQKFQNMQNNINSPFGLVTTKSTNLSQSYVKKYLEVKISPQALLSYQTEYMQCYGNSLFQNDAFGALIRTLPCLAQRRHKA